MGGSLALRLLATGHDVVVWNRSPSRVWPLAERGAVPATTPADTARRSGIVLVTVADPASLRAVTEGPDGLGAGADPESTIVLMSTVGPADVLRLASLLRPGVRLIDAPVLGSVSEAESGSLTIFAGGSGADIEQAAPVLSKLGSIVTVGTLGAGTAAKLTANAALLGTVALLGEVLALAEGLGLARETAYRVLAATPLAEQAARRMGAIESGRYPPRFALRLARKDANLFVEAAAAAGRETRLLPAVRRLLADAEDAGLGSLDYTAMLAAILERTPEPAAGGPRVPDASGRFRGPLRVDGLIVDLDGVVWRRGVPIDGAAGAIAALRAAGIRILFLTNDPGRSRSDIAARLQGMGIPAVAGDVVTSAAAMARVLADLDDLPSRTALVVGPASLSAEMAAAGFRIVSAEDASQAAVVVVGGHEAFDYGELRAACRAVRGGALLFATGRDAVYPGPDGMWPATGAVLAAIETAAGVGATVVGKPEAAIYEVARSALAGCGSVAVIGDHLTTDIAGARAAGLRGILVLTGVSTAIDLERSAVRPDLVADSLADCVPHVTRIT